MAKQKTSASQTRKNTRNKKKPVTTNALKFVRSTHSAVRSHLSNATELPEFLATTGTLTLKQRRILVAQARVLIEENFVHLPLKQAMHGVNPSQKLSLLQHRLDQATEQTMESEYSFHREMLEIFTSVRDLHTNYLLPAPYSNHIAFMPFNVEEYYEDDTPRFIATHLVQGFNHSHFKKGVEITAWNGVPITRAIEVAANAHAGSNYAARHARGVDGLTIRALKSSLPPDENWVIVGYIDLNGVAREMRQEWIISSVIDSNTGLDADIISQSAASQGLDIDADIRQQARKMLYAPQVIAAEKKKRKPELNKKAVDAGDSVTSTLAGVFRTKNVDTSAGTFGYIRIFTFHVENPDGFIDEFIRLVSLLPKNGLIIDVRGNGGGNILASEGLLQTLTPYPITPEPTQFINTPLNATLCKIHKNSPKGIDLGPWYQSIRDAITTGAIYSRAFPITSPEFANARGQQYHGPVVLITDARCYSATDIFAAGFQDHEIGPIIGIDANTGAGGANVWSHGLLKALRDTGPKTDNPYKTLPAGAGMRVAIRRTLRVGDRSGTPVEDIGVTPDIRHSMTKDDLLSSNIDLIDKAAKTLKALPVRQLDIDVAPATTTLDITATTLGLDRLDFYVDERPVKSIDIDDGTHGISLDILSGALMLVVAGYSKGDYVAARNYTISE